MALAKKLPASAGHFAEMKAELCSFSSTARVSTLYPNWQADSSLGICICIIVLDEHTNSHQYKTRTAFSHNTSTCLEIASCAFVCIPHQPSHTFRLD